MSKYEIDTKMKKQARNHVWYQTESLREYVKRSHPQQDERSLFFIENDIVFCDICKKEIQKNEKFEIHHAGKYSFNRLFEMFCEMKNIFGVPLIDLKNHFKIVKNEFQDGTRPFLQYSNKAEKTIIDWQRFHEKFARLKPVHFDCHVNHHKK